MTSFATPTRRSVPAGRVMRAAWRRSRITLTAVAAVFAVCALGLFIEAFTFRSDLAAHHMSSCLWNEGSPTCWRHQAWVALLDRPYYATWIPYVLLLVPGLAAAFGGVRWLAREYDTGAFRYTWTQSVSRTRWLAGNGLPLLATAAAGAALCGWAFNWWYSVRQAIAGNERVAAWDFTSFPLGLACYVSLTLLAFALAVLAAAVLRRTVPATLAALVGYLAMAAVADSWLRGWLISLHPVAARSSFASFLGSTPLKPGRYQVSAWFTDAGGHLVTVDTVWLRLQGGPASRWPRWLAEHHYTYWVSYQPASHLRTVRLEWSAVLLAVALVVLAVALWRVRTRPS